MGELAATEEAKPEQPATIMIDPSRVTVNNDGFVYRNVVVRMPVGATAECLKDPSIWARVQHSAKGLRRHDHLYLISFDETWVAEAIVSDADALKAVLIMSKVYTFPQRYDRLFEDSLYKISWDGQAFVVVRKADLRVITPAFPTAALAERALANLYPRKVG